jgi:fido (protein-threonine AMPylation protein)
MTSLKYGTGNDPYCYKNTDVLINQLNIKDASILESAENEISDISSSSIDFAPLLMIFFIYKIFTKTFLVIYMLGQVNLER